MNISHAKRHILIIHNDDPTRLWLEKNLKDDFTLSLAKGYSDALDLLSSSPIDLVITNETLPDSTIPTLAKKIHEHAQSNGFIPVLLIVDLIEAPLINEALEAGITDILKKPLDSNELKARIRLSLRLKTIQDDLNHLVTNLRKLVEKDPLTDVFSRQVLSKYASNEISRARRLRHPLSLLMIDIDRFKDINDTYGHPVGDEILIALSHLLVKNVRRHDIVIRYGGEEFVVILPHTSQKQASLVADKFCNLIHNHSFPTSKGSCNVTVSIGVSSLTNDTQSFEEFLQHADEALYRAKQLGRNRAVVDTTDES